MIDLYRDYAGLYDAAFDWDDSDQAETICELTGLSQGRVLEPMCGTGRLLRAFATKGFQTVGIDKSEQMLAIAEAHYLSAGFQGTWIKSNVTDFALENPCNLAVCPLNSLKYLPSSGAMEKHLCTLSCNLYPGSSYFIQLDLSQSAKIEKESWEFEFEGQQVRITWSCTDCTDGFETHLTRFEIPGKKVIEYEKRMKTWSFSEWLGLLNRSPFELSAVYDLNTFCQMAVDESLEHKRLYWQHLTLG